MGVWYYRKVRPGLLKMPGLSLRGTVTIMTVATPLSVSGRFIVDARGNRVKLCGVNWADAHQDDMTPGGLDYRHRDQIAAQIAAWGFNSVRLPFALATVTATAPVPASADRREPRPARAHALAGVPGMRTGTDPRRAHGDPELPPAVPWVVLLGF